MRNSMPRGRPKSTEPKKPCAAPGCDRSAVVKGFCQAHYERVKSGTHSDPLGPIGAWHSTDRRIDYDALIKDWVARDTDECIIWPFYLGPKGYGKVLINGVSHTASRYVCMKVHGQPPDADYEAAHECGNGHVGCVNPNHLTWKTRAMNVADKAYHRSMPFRPPRLPQGEPKYRRLRVEEVISIKGRLSEAPLKEVAREFDLHVRTIKRIANGRSYASV